MNNKQRWMGGFVLLGGGVLLAALLLKGNQEIEHPQHSATTAEKKAAEAQPAPAVTDGEMVQLQPLAVDVETEKRLLEEQRRAREKAVAEQEARAAEFLAMQQQAEAAAARKAAEEYAAINALRQQQNESSDNIPPELISDEKHKNPQQNTEKEKTDSQRAESEAEQKRKVEAEKKAAEEKRKAEAEKKAAEEKRKVEAEKKAAEEKKRKVEAEKKAAEEKKRKAEAEKKAAEEAKKKAEAEKARELLENGDKKWMVQVSLAANQANADAVVSKLRAKGYKVVTSQTSKGIRIMVGPSKDRDAADATRKKIAADSSLNMNSAWVIDWVPLEQR